MLWYHQKLVRQSQVVVTLSVLLLLLLLTFLVSPAAAQTQNLNFQLTWTNGAVSADGSNRPDQTIIQRKVAPSTTFSEVGRVEFPVAAYSDRIVSDPGNVTYCYRVAHINAGGTSPFTPEACATSPVVKRIPNVPNNNVPVIIIIGPFTVP